MVNYSKVLYTIKKLIVGYIVNRNITKIIINKRNILNFAKEDVLENDLCFLFTKKLG
jgi:hypothetical protein